jgi:hypothetical protein
LGGKKKTKHERIEKKKKKNAKVKKKRVVRACEAMNPFHANPLRDDI